MREVVQLYNFFDSAHQRNPSFAPAAAMTTVPLAQARQQLSGLLDRIQAGECVVISRYGKPVARLIPELSGQAGAELWLERLECDGVRGGARWPGRATFARRLFSGALCGGLF